MATDKGARRRAEIVQAAADILRESGPGAVSHRAVAHRVGCSLSATTYYFTGLNDLLEEAGRLNIARWATRAELVAERVDAESVPADLSGKLEIVLAACLPSDEESMPHYLQLIAAGAVPGIARAYRTGRSRLNGALGRVLRRIGSPQDPELIMAVVDGAAVSALSEGRDVRVTARQLLEAVLLSDLSREPIPGEPLPR